MGIPDHLTCLLRNLYAGQEAKLEEDMKKQIASKLGKMSPCFFNLYAEYINQNATLEEAQAGIKIAGRTINNLREADDTTFMAESKEELKSLLMKVKDESEKAGLKCNIQKTKIMASDPITSWQIDEERMETMADFIFLGSKITVDSDWNHKIKRCSLLVRKAMTNLESILKCRDVTLPTRVCTVNAAFSSRHVRMRELRHKEG